MYKTRLIPERVCICDRCGRAIAPHDHTEDQERLAIDFTAGYASVFGDGNRVQADLCQHCVKKVLGRWLRVSDPDETPPQPRPPEQPVRAWQPYQLREREQFNELRGSLNDSILRTRALQRGTQQAPQTKVNHD